MVSDTQALEYAVRQVNREGLLPSNVTLGFAVLSDCVTDNAAVAQALAFMPQVNCPDTSPASQDAVVPYDVIAVIGASHSTQSKAVSHVLGPAKVPLISVFSTSDELSDKSQFPFFLRIVPPDRLTVLAIFSLIRLYEWSYVSVVYLEGSYGENGYTQLRNLFDIHDLCFAATHKVSIAISDNEADVIAQSLVKHKKARVVIMITGPINTRKILTATARLTSPGTFIWIGSDSWYTDIPTMASLGRLLWGSMFLSPYMAYVKAYDDYFQHQTLARSDDPWLRDFWEEYFRCSLSNGTCPENLTISAHGDGYVAQAYTAYIADTVHMIANATARVLRSTHCAGRTGSQARACVTGPRLLEEIKLTQQEGYTGWLELDNDGDRLGRYEIRQLLPGDGGALTEMLVARFDARLGEFSHLRNFSWVHFQIAEDAQNPDIPESRCSWPCSIGEARIPQEVTCCWLCRPCRPNEQLVLNGTMCQTCPTFTWPDPATGYSTCYDISPDTPTFASLRGVLQTLAALACCALCLAVLVFFVRHWNCRIIKACSRELSLLMLLAIGLGYVTMVTLLAPPSEVSCRINYLLFCLSFAVIYGSLLVRAQRIYRIFDAGQRSTQRPRLIGSSHQLLLAAGLILVQVLICSLIMSEYGPWHRRFMAVAMEAYVEVSCEVPAVGLYSFLVYNLLQVAVCSLLAFKTRRLPDNFNESRFISMCVSTTLVIWLAFVPAYMVSGREHLRLLMLALALALNHSVALVFLFLPKVYAVLYLQDAADVSTANTRVPRTRASPGTVSAIHRCNGNNIAGSDVCSGTFGGSVGNVSTGPNFLQVGPAP
ncbi:metabotropic glutamate receptor 3-like [Pomacea canaliculata]|uniref:metabotropic glutamate receptor 3-like n=1 Tax=Pomacea canaliculata TaxID=400727 RepID=UPI000D72F006|nr:metabotropic glutamate receptor 3-like [Pomacea canaliculata]